MTFKKAFEALKNGYKIKLPSWGGYWVKEDDAIKMVTKSGEVIDIRDSKDIFYTVGFMTSDEWEIAEESDIRLDIYTVRFGEAIRLMKQGHKLARKGWNGKGMFVVYQKGYPDGIPCNKQTAEAWGINEGDLFKCNPYFQIRNVDGSHSMWVPSINDCLAEDWYVLKENQNE